MLQFTKSFFAVVAVTMLMAMSVSAGSSRVEYRDFRSGVGASMPESFFAAKDSSLMALIDSVQQDSSLGLAFYGTADGLECNDAENVGYAWSRVYAVKNRALSLGLPASKVIAVEADIKSDTGGYYRAAWVEIQSVLETRTIDDLERKVDLLTLAISTMSFSNQQSGTSDTVVHKTSNTDTSLSISVIHYNLFTRSDVVGTVTRFGPAVGVSVQFGWFNFYTDWTAAASFDQLLLAGRVARPVSRSITVLLGGHSNVSIGDNGGYEEIDYAFEGGAEWHNGAFSLGLYWTPSWYKDKTLDQKFDIDPINGRIEIRYNVLDIRI